MTITFPFTYPRLLRIRSKDGLHSVGPSQTNGFPKTGHSFGTQISDSVIENVILRRFAFPRACLSSRFAPCFCAVASSSCRRSFGRSRHRLDIFRQSEGGMFFHSDCGSLSQSITSFTVPLPVSRDATSVLQAQEAENPLILLRLIESRPRHG